MRLARARATRRKMPTVLYLMRVPSIFTGGLLSHDRDRGLLLRDAYLGQPNNGLSGLFSWINANRRQMFL